MNSQLLSTKKDFKDAVNRDLRDQETDSDYEWLEENLDEWYAVLLKIKISIETQLARFKSEKFLKGLELNDEEFDAWLEEKEVWRSDTLRLKGSVEARLVDVKLLRRSWQDKEKYLQDQISMLKLEL
jgi:hypothetical protein